MAQKTSWTGATLTESDINAYLMGEAGAWTTWSPSVTQTGAVTCTITSATYGRWGRLIVARAKLAVTGSGSAGAAISISLPVTAAVGSNSAVGTFWVYDASGVIGYTGAALLSSTSAVNGWGSTGYIGAAPSFGLANTDEISIQITYEAAS